MVFDKKKVSVKTFIKSLKNTRRFSFSIDLQPQESAILLKKNIAIDIFQILKQFF